MTMNHVGPVPHPRFPLSGVTPFTYRDGWTYLEVLENFRRWIRDELVPLVNDNAEKMEAAYEAALLVFLEAVNDFNEFKGEQVANYDAFVAEQLQNYNELLSNLVGYTIELTDDVYRASMMDGNVLEAYTKSAIDRLVPRRGTTFVDSTSTQTPTFRIEDTESNKSSIFNIHHYGGPADGNQQYAINIANRTDAAQAFVIHQYSAKSPAVQIDNTDIQPSIFINNTENPTTNPGREGTGAFFKLQPYGESGSFFWQNDLVMANLTSKNLEVQAPLANLFTFGVRADKDIIGLNVIKNATGEGSAAVIYNKGTGDGIYLYQTGNGRALNVLSTATGYHAVTIKGTKNVAVLESTTDDGITLDILKDGTGAGIVTRIINRGTGDNLAVIQGGSQVFRMRPTGELEIMTPAAGVVMQSPDGTRHKIAVTNAGEITATPLSN